MTWIYWAAGAVVYGLCARAMWRGVCREFEWRCAQRRRWRQAVLPSQPPQPLAADAPLGRDEVVA